MRPAHSSSRPPALGDLVLRGLVEGFAGIAALPLGDGPIDDTLFPVAVILLAVPMLGRRRLLVAPGLAIAFRSRTGLLTVRLTLKRLQA